MKNLFCTLLAALPLLAFSGCNRSFAGTGDTPPEAAPATQYKAGHGLQLSPAASRFLGLECAEVTARDVGEARGVAALPAAALLRTVKGDFVFVANGSWLLRTPVQLGPDTGGWYEVKAGLYEGDTVVTHGTLALWLAELSATNGGVGCADGH